MRIRAIAESELDALLTLYTHLHESDTPLPERALVEKTWGEILKSDAVHCFGRFDGANLVSSCVLTIIPNLSRGCRPYAVVENVVTDRKYRNQGHAKALLAHCLDWAFDKGCCKVMLLTGRKSEGVFRLYESVGFNRHAKQAFVTFPKALPTSGRGEEEK